MAAGGADVLGADVRAPGDDVDQGHAVAPAEVVVLLEPCQDRPGLGGGVEALLVRQLDELAGEGRRYDPRCCRDRPGTTSCASSAEQCLLQRRPANPAFDIGRAERRAAEKSTWRENVREVLRTLCRLLDARSILRGPLRRPPGPEAARPASKTASCSAPSTTFHRRTSAAAPGTNCPIDVERSGAVAVGTRPRELGPLRPRRGERLGHRATVHRWRSAMTRTCTRIPQGLVGEPGEDAATVREVGEMVLERREAGHDLPVDPERRHPIEEMPSSASGTAARMDRRTASSVLRSVGPARPGRRRSPLHP